LLVPFSADEGSRVIAGRDQPVARLCADDASAEIFRGLGFNCVRWQIDGRDLLYCPPPDELAERPTRGGVPVLFPFPNRIRDGRFTWDGKEYQLPRNDPSKQNAIHGFTPREPWGLVHLRSDAESAWMEAAFPPRATWTHQWPGVGVISLKIQLKPNSLRYSARVVNYGRDGHPFPFGLGFHPYFAVTADCRVQTPAQTRWELVDSLPTGRRLPVDGDYDLRQPRPVGELSLDDVYTDFSDTPPDADGLVERGRVEYPDGGVLRVRTSPAFRDLTLFTPPHRKAICLEPYTCPTDAIHLQEREDVGWQVLPPGGRWEGVVEFQLDRR
jgi:aldose 1-epimerase